jgi:hypothetical protein
MMCTIASDSASMWQPIWIGTQHRPSRCLHMLRLLSRFKDTRFSVAHNCKPDLAQTQMPRLPIRARRQLFN